MVAPVFRFACPRKRASPSCCGIAQRNTGATVRDKFVYQFISIQERKAFSARGIPPSSE